MCSTAVRWKSSDKDDRLSEHPARGIVSTDLRWSFDERYSCLVVLCEQTSPCPLSVSSSISIRFRFIRQEADAISIDLCSSAWRFVPNSFFDILQTIRQLDVLEDRSFLLANCRYRWCVLAPTLDHHRLDRWTNMEFDQSSIDSIALARLVVHLLLRSNRWIDRISAVAWTSPRLSDNETSSCESLRSQ